MRTNMNGRLCNEINQRYGVLGHHSFLVTVPRFFFYVASFPSYRLHIARVLKSAMSESVNVRMTAHGHFTHDPIKWINDMMAQSIIHDISIISMAAGRIFQVFSHFRSMPISFSGKFLSAHTCPHLFPFSNFVLLVECVSLFCGKSITPSGSWSNRLCSPRFASAFSVNWICRLHANGRIHAASCKS